MMMNRKTTNTYWNALYADQAVPALPSRFSVGSRNLHRLFKQHIKTGMRVLEIGCAPGKQLAYIGKHIGASIAGLDYSEHGIELSRNLFAKLDIACDLRCEDIFSTSFETNHFDVVYSNGVIEHFDDPAPVIEKHFELTIPGGVCLMIIPNYSGIYGRLQKYFDPKNLGIHNTDIMNLQHLRELVSEGLEGEAITYHHGRMSPWLLNFGNKWPIWVAQVANYTLNVIGLFQPFDIKEISPTIVLEIKKR
jgi:2-polyprenyl-3-methyl-5-hydroxy-6-metoxy-1,4-benzoquinol methylase